VKGIAYRRAMVERRKRWARHVIRQWGDPAGLELWNDAAFVGKFAQTPQMCSCWMCKHCTEYIEKRESESLRLAMLDV